MKIKVLIPCYSQNGRLDEWFITTGTLENYFKYNSDDGGWMNIHHKQKGTDTVRFNEILIHNPDLVKHIEENYPERFI